MLSHPYAELSRVLFLMRKVRFRFCSPQCSEPVKDLGLIRMLEDACWQYLGSLRQGLHNFPLYGQETLSTWSGQHHAGIVPHRWILHQSLPVLPTGPSDGGLWRLHHALLHRSQGIPRVRFSKPNRLKHRPRLLRIPAPHGRIFGKLRNALSHGLLCRFLWRLPLSCIVQRVLQSFLQPVPLPILADEDIWLRCEAMFPERPDIPPYNLF